MLCFVLTSLVAVALIAVSNAAASGGSVHLGLTKAEVQSARVELYEHEMHLHDEDPARFDHKFPVLGKILESEQGFDDFLAGHTFARLLCKHTPFLWRVVDGDILYHRIHPFAHGPQIPESLPTIHYGGPPCEGGSDGHCHDPGGSGVSIHSNAVPEPSSWVLMVGGLAFSLLAMTRRRVYRLAISRGPIAPAGLSWTNDS
jgi:hypothetical protein